MNTDMSDGDSTMPQTAVMVRRDQTWRTPEILQEDRPLEFRKAPEYVARGWAQLSSGLPDMSDYVHRDVIPPPPPVIYPPSIAIPDGCFLMYNFVFNPNRIPRDVFEIEGFMQQTTEMTPIFWRNVLECLRWCKWDLDNLHGFIKDATYEFNERKKNPTINAVPQDPRAQTFKMDGDMDANIKALYAVHGEKYRKLELIVKVLGPMEQQIEELADQFNLVEF